MLLFEAVKVEPAQKKILEFNEALQGNFSGTLTEKELLYFDSLCKVLSKPELFHSSEIDSAPQAVLTKLLEFPIDKLFPVLDIFRIFLCHNAASKFFSGSDAGASYVALLLNCLDNAASPKAVILLALRCFSNFFKSMSGSQTAFLRRGDIMDKARKHLTHPDKNTR